MSQINGFPILTPEAAVAGLKNEDTVSFSGFTPAGAAKVVPKALAARALSEHKAGRSFKVRVLTGASSGQVIDQRAVDEVRAGWERQTPAGRLGEPRELAALVAFLASERAGYLTGQSIAVDGGFARGLL